MAGLEAEAQTQAERHNRPGVVVCLRVIRRDVVHNRRLLHHNLRGLPYDNLWRRCAAFQPVDYFPVKLRFTEMLVGLLLVFAVIPVIAVS